ncbi:MAG TPA: hypothetical protein VGH19_21285 [Verrucomicrobiae bacterium]
MRGKLKELWHRHLDRKPWVFRDRFGLRYLFTPQDDIAHYCDRSAVIDNPSFLAYLQEVVKPGQTFVDLSPVIGGVTMLVAQKMKESGAVFAFASDADTYRQLVNNVALNRLTATVRVIGRNVLGSAAAPASATLDEFAASWSWTAVDHLRLKEPALLACLKTSAPALLKAGRIREILLDDVPPAALSDAVAVLRQCGFTVQMLSAEGKFQPLGSNTPSARLNLIATRLEATHG